MLLHRQHHAGTQHQVDLGGRCLPGLAGPVGVELTDGGAVVVVGGNRCVEVGVGDFAAGQPGQVFAQDLHLLDVELAADLVLVVLRHVEVANVLVLEQHLPHAREIADHVADRREQHAVENIQPSGQAEFDGRARNAADVALVIGVALDHLERITAAEDADRQHAGRVDQFPGHVHRHVADGLAAGCRRLPLLDGIEVQILEQRLAALDDAQNLGCVVHQRCSQAGVRRARKAARPSLASRVFIRRSRYRRSTSASRSRNSRTRGARSAVTAQASEAALRGARCSSKYASAAAAGSSASVCTRPIACAASPLTLRPDHSRSSAAAWFTRHGSRQLAAGAKTPSLISGWPSCVAGVAKIGPPASATSSPPPRHWPCTATRIGSGNSTIAISSACSEASIAAQRSARCSSTLAPKLKCGPSASSSTPRSPGLARCASSAACSAPIIAASMMLAFGRASRSRSSAPSRSSHACTGATTSAMVLGPGLDLVVQAADPALAGGQLLTQQHEVDLAVILGACVEGREAAARLGHHVQRQPGTRVFLVAVPGLELGLAQFFERLGGAVGEGQQDLGAQGLDACVEHRQVHRATLHQRLACVQRVAAHRLAVGVAAVLVVLALCLDERIGDELAVDLQRRHDVGQDPHLVGLVGRERFAQHAGGHRALGADGDRQEVRRAADGRRAVLGAGLAEARQILRDREVAGHADLLAATDAHAVDAADHRLVAGQDGADHVVEQAHVLAVFLRLPGVVLGVFLGVAAGAESLVADAGEDHAADVAGVRSRAHRQDHALDHVGGVGVVLARVVEPDPGVVQTFDHAAIGSARRTLLVAHARLGGVVDEVVVLEFVRRSVHGGVAPRFRRG